MNALKWIVTVLVLTVLIPIGVALIAATIIINQVVEVWPWSLYRSKQP